MPYAMVPPGYRAVLLGSAATADDLGTFTPLEESTAEGALILLRLDFTEYPSSEVLAQLNQACLDAGIPTWPGYDYIVYADIAGPSVYLAWQKGLAWMPIIIGMGMMMLVMWLMASLMKSLLQPEKGKPRKLKRPAEEVTA